MLRQYGGNLDEVSQVCDLILIGVGFHTAGVFYKLINHFGTPIWNSYYALLFIYSISWVVGSKIYNVYRSRRFVSFWREIVQMGKTHVFALMLTFVSTSVFDPTSRLFQLYFGSFALIFTYFIHVTTRWVLESWRRNGKNKRYVLVLGGGAAAEAYVQKVKSSPQLGYSLIGFLAPKQTELDIPYLGDYSKLDEIVNSRVIDLTVITTLTSDDRIQESLELLRVMGKTTAILLDDAVSEVSRPIDFGGLSMVVYDGYPLSPFNEVAKRLLDIVISLCGLVAASPVMLVIALTIKLTSSGPIFFVQERIGLNGRSFFMYKFRSMVSNAEDLKNRLEHLNEMDGPVFKIKNDPRITSVGRFIRKTSLDELPQLLNVLKGDMSLVGPRPPLRSEVNMYDPKHRKRLSVRPGLTCIWQVSGRNNINFEQWMEMDAEYIERRSLLLDMQILAKTLPVVLARKGAS